MYSSPSSVVWCSWLSHIVNTDKVLSSNLSMIITFSLRLRAQDYTVKECGIQPVEWMLSVKAPESGEHDCKNMIILEQNLFIVYTQVSVFPN